jgi:hypothetical protein
MHMLKELNDEQTLELLTRLALSHLNLISDRNPVRHRLTAYVLNQQWLQIVEFPTIDYAEISVSDAIHIRQVLALFQKAEFLPIETDKLKNTWSGFEESESRCKMSNDVFKAHRRGEFLFPRGVDSVLHAATVKIAKVLGNVPKLDELQLGFGPGATSNVKKKNACARAKLGAVPTCSEEFIPLLPELLNCVPQYTEAHGTDSVHRATGLPSTVVDVDVYASVCEFVPKTATNYRLIRKGPQLNGWVSKGYGQHIAQGLKAAGQDIPTGQTRNKRLAREGSLTGALATLDLKQASDSISIEFMRHVLPFDWFEALSKVRVGLVVEPEELTAGVVKTRLTEGFCGMGDGFTFPLQTLVYWALASSLSDVASVYGDDIIVKQHAVPRLTKVLNACGFVVNEKKSFSVGPFRESCGGDYYLGVDIRPVYVKERLTYIKLFALHNNYVRRHGSTPELAAIILEYIPEMLKLFGPDEYGDGHLLGECPKQYHNRDRGWGGYTFDTYVAKTAKSYIRCQRGDYVLPYWTTYVAQPEEFEYVWKLINGKMSLVQKGTHRPASEAQGVKTIKARLKYRGKKYTVVLDAVPSLALPDVLSYERKSIYTLQPW